MYYSLINSMNRVAPSLPIITTGLRLNLDAGNTLSYSGSGTTWNDLSTTVNNATLINGVGYSSSNNGCLLFDGTNDYSLCANDTGLDSQTITMESWVYLNSSLGQNAFIFEKGSVNTQYSNFFANGNFLFRTQGLSNLDLTINASTYMNLNTWYNITCTYGSGVKSIYINGALVAQSTGITGTIPTNNFGLFIGCYYPSGGSPTFYINGRIAVIRAYNIALSSTQVVNNFNSIKSRYGY